MLLLKNYTNLYTHPSQSNQIINIIKSFLNKNNVIIDATAGMGGDSIFFCKYFKHVYCIEINEECINYLEHNLNNFNNKDIFNINCIDALKIINYDAIFLDPPWGGKNYKNIEQLDLYLEDSVNINNNVLDIINSLYFYTNYIFLKAPLNFNLDYKKILWDTLKYPIYKYGEKQSEKQSEKQRKLLFYLIVFIKNK